MSRINKNAIWQEHFQSWKESGLSQINFCKTHSLNIHTFRWRLCKMKNTEITCTDLVQIPVPVKLQPAQLTVRIGEHLHISIPNDFDADLLIRVVKTLEHSL